VTTVLNKTLKREVRIGDRAYVLTLSPLTLKLTLKGKRKGLELQWEALVSGEAALAAALNASLSRLTTEPAPRTELKAGPGVRLPKLGIRKTAR
jgi:hypothetical protein